MRLFLHALRNEQRLFWRQRESAIFTFALPILLFLIFGSVYGDSKVEGIRGANWLVAGMIGYGVMSTAYAGLAITLIIRRESGVLKRLRGTPIPPIAYLLSVVASTVIVFVIQTVIIVVVGNLLFDVDWPTNPGSLVLVVLLGAAAFAALGLATTPLVRSDEGASAVITAVYFPITIISGTFFSPHSFLKNIAEVLPVSYFVRLVRETVLLDREIWSDGTAIAVIAAWGAVGLVVALRKFRWEPRDR